MLRAATRRLASTTTKTTSTTTLAHSRVYRHRSVAADEPLLRRVFDDVGTLTAALEHQAERVPRAEGFGAKAGKDGFTWWTYAEMRDESAVVAAALASLGVRAGANVGLFADNCRDWVLVEAACQRMRAVPTALYATLGADAVAYIVQHAEIEVLVVSAAKLATLGELPASVRHVVVLESPVSAADAPPSQRVVVPPPTRPSSMRDDVAVHSFAGLVRGVDGASVDSAASSSPAPTSEDVAVLMYTSGTTGTPKGVVITHGAMVAAVAGLARVFTIDENDRHLSYLPLAHIFERVAMQTVLHFGGRVGFYGGVQARLAEDIRALEPTMLVGVPRVLERIQDVMVRKLPKSNTLLGRYASAAQAATYRAVVAGGEAPFWARPVIKKARDALSPRLRFVVSGGAPLATSTQQFLVGALGVPVVQGYGLTETAAGASIGGPNDGEFDGHCGQVLPSCEVKLVAVPDLGYKDVVQQGGEILVRGPTLASGYYKRESDDFDAEGWFHTGDIGRIEEQRNVLRIVDRKKHMFKLANGEYVASERIEGILKQSTLANFAYVYGDSYHRHLVALISVDEDEVASQGLQDDRDRLRERLLEDFERLGGEEGLQAFERVRDVIIADEEFSIDNGLLTPSLKLKRKELKELYGERLEKALEKVG